MRVDQLLVHRQLASTRSQAQRLIADGVQWLSGDVWKRVAKNGDEVPESAEIRLLDDSEARYVSRGGLKLEGALKTIGLDVTGFLCLDVGQSTGGFTDCLLQQGAAQVVGVDVGQGQLHPQLRDDERVLCIEKVNARSLSATELIAAHDRPRTQQALERLEVGREHVGKGGIVTDPAMYKMVEERVRAAHTKLGLTVQAWFESPVQGGDGNHEFFIYSRK